MCTLCIQVYSNVYSLCIPMCTVCILSPGWGDSDGSPSEGGMTADSLFMYHRLKRAVANKPLYVWGHSLGTGYLLTHSLTHSLTHFLSVSQSLTTSQSVSNSLPVSQSVMCAPLCVSEWPPTWWEDSVTQVWWRGHWEQWCGILTGGVCTGSCV